MDIPRNLDDPQKYAEWEAGQDGGRVGSPSHLSPPTYLDNFQIILKTYEFGLRFRENSWNATVRRVCASIKVGRMKNKKAFKGEGPP